MSQSEIRGIPVAGKTSSLFPGMCPIYIHQLILDDSSHKLAGAFHAGNGWEWMRMGLSFMVVMVIMVIMDPFWGFFEHHLQPYQLEMKYP